MKEILSDIGDFFTSFFGLKTAKLNLLIMLSTFFLVKFNIIFADTFFVFAAITAVVVVDFIFGSIANRKDFKTEKALKIVWYLGGYYMITGTCLFMEAAFPVASWLTETIMIPILVFQILSIVKNAHKCGIISGGVLRTILNNIDKHKDEEIQKEQEDQQA